MRNLTTAEAAGELGVSASRVRKLIEDGRLPAEKLGRDWLIKPKDLEKVRKRTPGRPKGK